MARRRRRSSLHGLHDAAFWIAIAGIAVRVSTCISSTRRCPPGSRNALGPVYTLLVNKYYFDKFNEWFFADGSRRIGDAAVERRRRKGHRRRSSTDRAHGRLVGGDAAPDAIGLRLSLRVHDDHRACSRCSLVGCVRLMTPATRLLARRLLRCPSLASGPIRRCACCWRATGTRCKARWTRAGRRARGLPGRDAAVHAVRCVDVGDAVRRAHANGSVLRHLLPPRHRRHSVLFIMLNSFTTLLVVMGGMGGDQGARRAVHGGVPDHVGPHQRRVRGARRRSCSTCSSRRC